MKRFTSFVLPIVVLTIVAGCSSDVRNVPPQFVGRQLTPTGWENRLYSPGQVDIGTLDTQRRGNSLVLIQTSAFAVKESFLGAQAMEDKEDHRVFTADKTPVSLDVRFMFTSPDIQKDPESVKRFFTLGNPVASKEENRVMYISLESIYQEQGRLQVRGKIRDVMSGFKSFNDAFERRAELNKEIRSIVTSVLQERSVPLVLVDCQISNIKPDPLVWENQVKVQAADAEIETMTKLQGYLDKNPTARMIFVLSKLKEIAAIASERGNNTIIISAIGDMTSSPEKSVPLILRPPVSNHGELKPGGKKGLPLVEKIKD
jgi:regulator of protease activity HflC (stomatin/prohibitin superfamily)